MAERSIYAVRRTDLLQAASEIEDLLFRLEEWRNLFPGKTPHEVSLLLAAANFLVKANGKLMAENERMREQRPLTDEEKAWAEKAWQEYKASKPKSAEQPLPEALLECTGDKIVPWRHNVELSDSRPL
jgi:hypothetical protein